MNRLVLPITLVLACSSRPMRTLPPDGGLPDGVVPADGGRDSAWASGEALANPGVVPSVSVSISDEVCALAADGTIDCWGNVRYVPPTGTFISVGVGSGFACGVRTDRTLACWGGDAFGDTLPPAGAFNSVSAGWDFACGIRIDGTLACWGNSARGDTTPPAGTFRYISLASRTGGYDCGVRTDGTLACWGDDGRGETRLPDGTFTSVEVGRGGCPCGVTTAGNIACCKTSSSGAGGTITCTAPAPTGPFIAISGSYFLKADGTVVPWCGFRSNLPEGPFISISAGSTTACGVKVDGTVACWWIS